MVFGSCRSRSPQTRVLDLSYNDSLVKDSLVRKIFEIRYNQPEAVPPILEQIRIIEQRYDPAMASQNYYSAQVYLLSNIKKKPDSARMFLDSQFLMLKQGQLNADNLKAKTAFSKATYFLGSELYDSAVNNALSALDLLQQTTDSTLLYNIYGTISDLYAYQGNLKKSSEYYKYFIRQALQLKNPARDAVILLNGYCRFAEASDSIKNMATTYLFVAKHAVDSLHLDGLKPILYTNLASYYYDQQQADSGRWYAQLSIKEMEDNPSPNNQPELSYLMLINHYIKKDQTDSAALLLQQMLLSSDTAKYFRQDLRTYYKYAYLLAKKQHQLEHALAYEERYAVLTDEIHEAENNKLLLDYEARMTYMANELEIRSKEFDVKRQKNYVIFSTIITILMFGFTISILYYKKKKRLIEQQYWMQLQMRRDSEYRNRLWEERNRISREMHDDLGSTLTSTVMAVEIAEQFPEQKEHLNIVKERSLNLHQQINEIIWNLNVQNDNLRSLNHYMIRFAKNFLEQAGIAFSWEEQVRDENTVIQSFQRRALYLSFKEIIHNIVKHSMATKVKLVITCADKMYYFAVSDNGIGLQKNVKSSENSQGYGMTNIHRNISNLFGTVTWTKGENGIGTRVEVSIEMLT
ncbi:Sensor histidine kinase DesK [compost metagenome]